MKVAQLPSRLRVVFALLATTVLIACMAGTAGAVNVTLRIEGENSTIFNGPISTSATSVKTTNSGACADDASPAENVTKPTGMTAVANWAAATSTPYNSQYSGTFLCRVGSLIASEYNSDQSVLQNFWLMKLNNRVKDPGGAYLTGATELKSGDEVLWYWTDNQKDGWATLAIDLPSAIQTGTTAAGTVYKHNSYTDERTAGAGASVSLGGNTVVAGADGKFSLAFPTAGPQVVTVTSGGSIRGSKFVTVTDAPVIPPVVKTVKQLRVEARRKCLRTYKWHRTSSPRYKKCVAKANRIGKKKKK